MVEDVDLERRILRILNKDRSTNIFLEIQENSIKEQVSKLEENVRSTGFDVEYIHTGSVIRREEVFAKYSIDE